jgi:hypothetical protein
MGPMKRTIRVSLFAALAYIGSIVSSSHSCQADKGKALVVGYGASLVAAGIVSAVGEEGRSRPRRRKKGEPQLVKRFVKCAARRDGDRLSLVIRVELEDGVLWTYGYGGTPAEPPEIIWMGQRADKPIEPNRLCTAIRVERADQRDIDDWKKNPQLAALTPDSAARTVVLFVKLPRIFSENPRVLAATVADGAAWLRQPDGQGTELAVPDWRSER